MKLLMKAQSTDLFGQKINLNFDNLGQTFSTPYGIIVSIFIYLIVFLYSGVRSNVLFNQSEFTVSSVSQPIDIVNTLGNVYMNQTKMLFYLVVFKQQSMANFNISQYLNITFQKWTVQLDNAQSSLMNEYKTRQCKQKDFGNDARAIEQFSKINNNHYLNLCPDIQDADDIYISGDYSNYFGNQTYLQFSVQRCNNLSNECKSEQEYQEFIRDLILNPQINQLQMNFNLFGSEPLFSQLQTLQPFSPILSLRNLSLSYITFIKQNQYSTQDDFIQYGQNTQAGTFYDVSKSEQFLVEYDGSCLYRWAINLSNVQTIHSRQTYNFLQMLGDIGGVISILVSTCQFIFNPFIQFNLKFAFLKKLYKVKIKQNELLQNSKYKTNNQDISVSLCTQFILFLSLLLNRLQSKLCKLKYRQLKQLMEKGEKKLDEELDIIKIIEQIRIIKKEDESNFIIDFDNHLTQSDTSELDKTLIINKVTEMQSNQFDNRNQNYLSIQYKVANRNKIINQLDKRKEHIAERIQKSNNFVGDQFENRIQMKLQRAYLPQKNINFYND